MNATLKIALAEPSDIVRTGLLLQFKKITAFRFQFHEIPDTPRLVDNLRMHQPDLLIINPAITATHSLAQLKREGNRNMKCIALLLSFAHPDLLQPFDEQIHLYNNSDDIKRKLERLYPNQLQSPALEQQPLSAREKEIVICVAKGLTNRAIADRLFLSTHTVITHRRNIARKLQIHSPAALTVYAIVNRLVQLRDIE